MKTLKPFRSIFVAAVLFSTFILSHCHVSPSAECNETPCPDPPPTVSELLGDGEDPVDFGLLRASWADTGFDENGAIVAMWSTHIDHRFSFYRNLLHEASATGSTPLVERQAYKIQPPILASRSVSGREIHFSWMPEWGIADVVSDLTRFLAYEDIPGRLTTLDACNVTETSYAVGAGGSGGRAWMAISRSCSTDTCPFGNVVLRPLDFPTNNAPVLCAFQDRSSIFKRHVELHPKLQAGLAFFGGAEVVQFAFDETGVIREAASPVLPHLKLHAFFPDKERAVLTWMQLGGNRESLVESEVAPDGTLQFVPSQLDPYLEGVSILERIPQGLLAIGRQRFETIPEGAKAWPMMAVLIKDDGSHLTVSYGDVPVSSKNLRLFVQDDVVGLFWSEVVINDAGNKYRRLWGKRLRFD